jgi:hypothetical protein
MLESIMAESGDSGDVVFWSGSSQRCLVRAWTPGRDGTTTHSGVRHEESQESQIDEISSDQQRVRQIDQCSECIVGNDLLFKTPDISALPSYRSNPTTSKKADTPKTHGLIPTQHLQIRQHLQLELIIRAQWLPSCSVLGQQPAPTGSGGCRRARNEYRPMRGVLGCVADEVGKSQLTSIRVGRMEEFEKVGQG